VLKVKEQMWKHIVDTSIVKENYLYFSISHYMYKVAQKSKPLPNYQKIVLNRIKFCD